MAFSEPLDAYFVDFGVTAAPAIGASITVIFDRDHMQAIAGEISGTRPAALARSADIAAFQSRATTLTIEGASYLVTDIQPDGTGLALLLLEVR